MMFDQQKARSTQLEIQRQIRIIKDALLIINEQMSLLESTLEIKSSQRELFDFEMEDEGPMINSHETFVPDSDPF